MLEANEFKKSDPEKANQIYLNGLLQFPNSPELLGSYARFLHNIRKDYDQAERYYQRALEADPKNANTLGNYAGFILAIKQQDKGWEFFNRSEKLTEDPSLKLELQFYTYAHHKDKQSRNNAFEEIKLALFDDIRSPDFDLSANVERAIADGDPEPKFLAQLATVISDEAKIETLDSFDVWKNSIKP